MTIVWINKKYRNNLKASLKFMEIQVAKIYKLGIILKDLTQW
jgi:hypothetical protein